MILYWSLIVSSSTLPLRHYFQQAEAHYIPPARITPKLLPSCTVFRTTWHHVVSSSCSSAKTTAAKRRSGGPSFPATWLPRASGDKSRATTAMRKSSKNFRRLAEPTARHPWVRVWCDVLFSFLPQEHYVECKRFPLICLSCRQRGIPRDQVQAPPLPTHRNKPRGKVTIFSTTCILLFYDSASI